MTNFLCISIEVLCFFGLIVFDSIFNQYLYLTKNGIQPFKQGFFCDDESIRKPYQKESLSYPGTLSIGIIISLAMIMALEVGNHLTKSKSKEKTKDDGKKVGPVVIPTYIMRMLHHMAIFGFGLTVLLVFCNIVKVLTGRLRPNFLAVCKPNTTLFNCSSGYITADVCTGDPLEVNNARLSFPSGYATFSAYCLVFVAICLEAVICLRRYKLLRSLLQTVLLLFAFATGLSRIRDYYHYWSDVVAGFSLGTFGAWFVTTKVMQIFDHEQDKTPHIELSSEDATFPFDTYNR